MVKDLKYYTILELDPQCDQDQIRKAYRRLSLKWHPDKNVNSKEQAEVMFKQIAEAYEVLKDHSMDNSFDDFGSQNFTSNSRHFQQGFASFGSSSNINQSFFSNSQSANLFGIPNDHMNMHQSIHNTFAQNSFFPQPFLNDPFFNNGPQMFQDNFSFSSSANLLNHQPVGNTVRSSVHIINGQRYQTVEEVDSMGNIKITETAPDGSTKVKTINSSSDPSNSKSIDISYINDSQIKANPTIGYTSRIYENPNSRSSVSSSNINLNSARTNLKTSSLSSIPSVLSSNYNSGRQINREINPQKYEPRQELINIPSDTSFQSEKSRDNIHSGTSKSPIYISSPHSSRTRKPYMDSEQIKKRPAYSQNYREASASSGLDDANILLKNSKTSTLGKIYNPKYDEYIAKYGKPGSKSAASNTRINRSDYTQNLNTQPPTTSSTNVQKQAFDNNRLIVIDDEESISPQNSTQRQYPEGFTVYKNPNGGYDQRKIFNPRPSAQEYKSFRHRNHN
ncbi:DnaJ-like protein [Smittium culicis]|uniref:DnaJ-like protein n=1 Tax=Smittium culicis TaxID=133412 RepID=A0A1R1XZP0_9FUNG|nr:DnaJ-like protein [Smittium culicis]